jgi:hypothetical protein
MREKEVVGSIRIRFTNDWVDTSTRRRKVREGYRPAEVTFACLILVGYRVDVYSCSVVSCFESVLSVKRLDQGFCMYEATAVRVLACMIDDKSDVDDNVAASYDKPV